MQVFDLFFKILRKRYKALLLFIVVFLVISFGRLYAESPTESFKEVSLYMAVFDRDMTPSSKAFVEMLDKKHELKEVEYDEDAMLDMLYWREVDYILVIKPGFEENLSAGKTEGFFEDFKVHEGFTERYMASCLDEYVKTAEAYIESGLTTAEAAARASEVLAEDTAVEFVSQNTDDSTEFGEKLLIYFQYMPYILVSVMCYSLCVILIVINKKDVRFRTDCSCMTSKSGTAQIFAASGILVLAIWLVLMIAGIVLNGGIYDGKAWFAVLNSLAFTFVAASFAVFLSNLITDENSINIIGQIVGLGMSFLSGVFIPQEIMSSSVLSAARFLPAYWYEKLNNCLTGEGGEVFEAGKCFGYMGVQLCFGVIFVLLTLIIRRSKKNETTA